MDRQTRLLSVLIIFVGLIAGYVIYSGSSGIVESGIPALKEDSKDSLSQFNNISLNFTVFDSPDLKLLRQFGEAPVNPGQTGKADLFATF